MVFVFMHRTVSCNRFFVTLGDCLEDKMVLATTGNCEIDRLSDCMSGAT
jgi:hypothetical protein